MTGPSMEQLAADLGITVEQVEAGLQEAVDLGFLSVLGDDGETITYRATLPEEETS